MPEPVDYHAYDWSPRRGDTERTPPVAVLTGDGGTVDLTDWTIRAQVRGRNDELLHTFTPDVGIVVGSGEATFDDDRPPVTTSTVRLRMLPGDWSTIPTRLRSAVYDVEISRGTGTDAVVKTVTGGAFEPVEDVTRG